MSRIRVLELSTLFGGIARSRAYRIADRAEPLNYDGSTLSLDFTTGVLDPRLTFTRDSNATFINSSGYVQWADANLIAQSETFSGSPWGAAGALTVASATTTNPIGGTTATSVTLNATTSSAGLNAIPSHAVGIPYVFRIWVKGNTTTKISIGLLSSGSWLTNVTVTAVAGFTGVTIAGSTYRNITNLSTTQWTQLEMKYTAATTGSDYVYLYPATPSPQTLGDSLYLWGAQLNPGTTACPYYKTTASTYQAPRFDYDPTTLTPRGLLIEGSASNLTKYSDDLSQVSGINQWYGANMNTPTVPGGAPNSPYGTTAASWKLVATAGAGFHVWRYGASFTAADYTFSFWAKAAEYDRIVLSDVGTGRGACSFVLTGNGTATAIAGTVTPTNPTIVPYANGWYRCSVTITMTAATYGIGIAGYPVGTTLNAFGASYTADGTSGVYATMFQTELGSGASSYIPTGASQGSRAGESCALALSAIPLVTSEGSFVVRYDAPRANLGASVTSILNTDYQATEWIGLFQSVSSVTVSLGSWSGQSNISAGTVTSNIAAFSYGAWTGSVVPVSFVVNNSAVTNANRDWNPALPTWLMIGAASSTGSSTANRDWLNACIRSVKYWPTRLPDAQLKSLTT